MPPLLSRELGDRSPGPARLCWGGGGIREGGTWRLTAGLTHEGLLASVDADVVVEGGHLLEGPAAVGTLVRLVV